MQTLLLRTEGQLPCSKYTMSMVSAAPSTSILATGLFDSC
jgi:hypothetical protein